MANKMAWVDQRGDTLWVSTSDRINIYQASPDPQLPPPDVRVGQYMRALVPHGYQIPLIYQSRTTIKTRD